MGSVRVPPNTDVVVQECSTCSSCSHLSSLLLCRISVFLASLGGLTNLVPVSTYSSHSSALCPILANNFPCPILGADPYFLFLPWGR